MNTVPSRGRRTGQPDTKEAIRQAARARFLADGYQSVTLRNIATDAGVDVALISYYFGSKRGLFGASMALPADPTELFAAAVEQGVDGLPERVLRRMLAVWDNPETGEPLRAIAGLAATDPEFARLAREAVASEIVGKLRDALGAQGGAERAAAFTTVMTGVIFARYVLRLEPITSMDADQVVAHLGPALQSTIEPEPTSLRRTPPSR